MAVLVVENENTLNNWRSRYLGLEGENGRLNA